MAPSPAAETAALHQGPRGHALLGNLRDFNRDQLGFYARCAREHGDVVAVRLAPSRGLLIYHPDAIEEVLVVRNRDFIQSRGLLRAHFSEIVAVVDVTDHEAGSDPFYTPEKR
jgi:hypothetical protein